MTQCKQYVLLLRDGPLFSIRYKVGVLSVAKRVSAAQAKAQLSALSAEVAFGGQQVIIERRGKPLVALVSMADLELLEQVRSTSALPRGALALVGAWERASDDELNSFVEDIYAYRALDAGRPVEIGP